MLTRLKERAAITSVEVTLRSKAQIRVIKVGTSAASRRANTFQPTINEEFQCPHCWVDRGMRATVIITTHHGEKVTARCLLCNDLTDIS